VNFQPAAGAGGENYGWRCLEGPACTTFGECDCASLDTVLPLHAYAHNEPGQPFRCSIVGGPVYRGCAIPDLAGTYFFADYCSGQIWTLTREGSRVSVLDRTAELMPASPLALTNPSSFGTDAAGEIYICDRAGMSGEIYKIVPASGTPGFLATDPPDDVIDARTPLGPDGQTPLGPTQATFYFDGPTPCASPDLFVVEQMGGAGLPPSVAGVAAVPGDGLRVTLSGPVQPRAWTTITHGPSLGSVRIGYLPGDVNGNRASTPIDILALIDALNGVGPVLPLSSTDLDRSGVAAPADIIMLIDLLNGAGNLDSYLNAQLPE
jgi:hypothetical protein